MKTIIKSHITNVAMLALLCVGGSAQAKVNVSALFRPSAPVMTLVQKKSFFAAHPVLKWGGMSLATGAVVFAAIEGYRSYKNGENFFSLIKKDLGCGYSKARKYVYPIHDDLTAVQKEIEATKLEIAKNEQLFASMSGYVLAGVEDTLKTLRAKLTRLEKQEKAYAKRLGSLSLVQQHEDKEGDLRRVQEYKNEIAEIENSIKAKNLYLKEHESDTQDKQQVVHNEIEYLRKQLASAHENLRASQMLIN